MEETLQFVIEHGYLMLFVWILVEQLGLPLPSIPILLTAGALSGTGDLYWPGVIGISAFAALLSDLTWYELGRRRGAAILRLLCKIALEPDSCVRKTENVFYRHGARTLLVAKFFPGLNTAAPPMAGMFGMALGKFLLFDIAGVTFWAFGWTGLGYLFSNQLEQVLTYAAGFGTLSFGAVVAGLAGHLAWKYIQRERMIRRMRGARISPENVKQLLDEDESILIVDLRHRVEFLSDPYTLPGALHLPMEEFEKRHGEIPRDREIILYCT